MVVKCFQELTGFGQDRSSDHNQPTLFRSLDYLRIGKVTQKRKVFFKEKFFLIDKVTHFDRPFVTAVTTGAN